MKAQAALDHYDPRSWQARPAGAKETTWTPGRHCGLMFQYNIKQIELYISYIINNRFFGRDSLLIRASRTRHLRVNPVCVAALSLTKRKRGDIDAMLKSQSVERFVWDLVVV